MNKALENTSFIVSVKNKQNKLIGIARCFSDWVFHTYLADIIVHPDYQWYGIGKEMIKIIKEKYSHTSIYLDAFQQSKNFFKNVDLCSVMICLFFLKKVKKNKLNLL